MHRSIILTFASFALLLTACSDYSSGGGITPPVAQGQQINPVVGGSPGAGMHPGASAQPTATPSAPPGDQATYAVADAQNGIRCPDVNGFSCILHVNVPAATPTPRAGTHFAMPSPTPTASPTPSGSPQPTPTATPTPSISLHLEAQPRDVPAMVNPSDKSVSTTALIALRATTSQDVPLHGSSSVDFILPQGQIGGRGFAVQLFRETPTRHNRPTDTYVGSYSSSTTNGTTLHFEITPPQVVTMKRGETWLLVLYASELPSATASPSAAASRTPSTAPSPSTSP